MKRVVLVRKAASESSPSNGHNSRQGVNRLCQGLGGGGVIDGGRGEWRKAAESRSWKEVRLILGIGVGEKTGLCRLLRQPRGTEAAPSGGNMLFAHGLGRW